MEGIKEVQGKTKRTRPPRGGAAVDSLPHSLPSV
jgi:hypothetical protein